MQRDEPMRMAMPLLFALTACVEVEALDSANINWIDFNPRLRPDLMPLVPLRGLYLQ